MKITFAGTAIASGPGFGLDAVEGFILDEAEQVIQTVKPPRAADAISIARNNRTRSVSGSVMPAPTSSLGAAMLLRAALYDNLPTTGDLVLQQDTQIVTWPGAILKTFRTLKNIKGISYGFTLVFIPNGPAVPSTAGGGGSGSGGMGTEAGGGIGTEGGGTLGTES
jgi:hypothetical protein